MGAQALRRRPARIVDAADKPGWDAVKKSLDAASKVVNPGQFHRIKALSPARFKVLDRCKTIV